MTILAGKLPGLFLLPRKNGVNICRCQGFESAKYEIMTARKILRNFNPRSGYLINVSLNFTDKTRS